MNGTEQAPGHSIAQSHQEEVSPWLTPAEAALYLRVAIGTLRNWVSQKRIPFARRGRVVRFERRVLDQWLRDGSGQRGHRRKIDSG